MTERIVPTISRNARKVRVLKQLLDIPKPDKWASAVTSIWKQKTDSELSLSHRAYENRLKINAFDLLTVTILKEENQLE